MGDKISTHREKISVNKDDLLSWAERLDSLRKCMIEPDKCTHEGGIDEVGIDTTLEQIVGEIKYTVEE